MNLNSAKFVPAKEQCKNTDAAEEEFFHSAEPSNSNYVKQYFPPFSLFVKPAIFRPDPQVKTRAPRERRRSGRITSLFLWGQANDKPDRHSRQKLNSSANFSNHELSLQLFSRSLACVSATFFPRRMRARARLSQNLETAYVAV